MVQQVMSRRGTPTQWATANTVLADGEIGVERGSGIPTKIKIGDGVTAWNSLPYFAGTAGGNVKVRAATTANITIATALNNGDVLDGVTLATNDLVLVKNQTTASQNGIYVVGVTPARSVDFDTFDEHAGVLVVVEEGTANADSYWLCSADIGGTLGTTAINFVKKDLVNSDGLTEGSTNLFFTAGRAATKLDATNPVASGSLTVDGPLITPANAMGALAINVAKSDNTKSVSVDSTFTFSATPAADSSFGMILTNGDASNPHVHTIPSSFSVARQATVTTFAIPKGGVMHLSWHYVGGVALLYGDVSSEDIAEESIASAATVDLGSTLSRNVNITGNTGPITSFGTAPAGTVRKFTLASNPTITHNATSLICPGGVSITGAAGGTGEAFSMGGGNWRIRYYTAPTAPAASSGDIKVYSLGAAVAYSTNDTTEHTMLTYTVPANTLGVKGRLHIAIKTSSNDSAATDQWRIKFGGTTFFQHNHNGTGQRYTSSEVRIANRNSAASQIGAINRTDLVSDVGNGQNTAFVTAAIDTTQNQDITVTVTKNVGTNTATLEDLSIQVITPSL